MEAGQGHGMNARPTVDDLHTAFAERLELQWVAGRAGGAREIAVGEIRQPALLVGHLNLINPKAVQVLGPTELAHLAALADDERTTTIARLFAAAPVLVLVSDGLAPPPAIAEAAEASGTALISSQLGCDELIDRLGFDLLDLLARRLTLHGVFIEVLGVGVLLTGGSGVGKSELALDLIARGHRLIADDTPEFTRVAPDLVMGACPEPLGDFLEVRGLGILNVRMMYGDNAVKRAKYLGLIVNLIGMPGDRGEIDRLAGMLGEREVLGVRVPEVPLYVDPVRNLAVLVEAAVRQHLLRRRGYDGGRDLAERQQALLLPGVAS
jgi:HPr kinase/phosphorylase